MKVLATLSILSAMILAGCGANKDVSATESARQTPQIKYDVENVKGQVSEIAAAIDGDTSIVNLTFQTGCGIDLLNVQSSLVKGDAGKNATLYVDATAKIQTSGIHCMAIQFEAKTIELKGSYSAANLDVVFLQGPTADAPKDLTGASSLSSANLVSIDGLCPKGAKCIIGGTRLTIIAPTGGCVDQVGPVVAKVIKNDGNKATILIGGVSLRREASKVVRCIVAATETFSVELPFEFFSSAELVLMK